MNYFNDRRFVKFWIDGLPDSLLSAGVVASAIYLGFFGKVTTHLDKKMSETSLMDTAINACRGSHENDWSWRTRKKFIDHHFEKNPDEDYLKMLNSYSWALINSKVLGCRYDPSHMEKLHSMAAEAGILGDLEMGGPTPQIIPYQPPNTNRRGRGRGRGGHMNGTLPETFVENGGPVVEMSHQSPSLVPPPSVGQQNGSLDGSPVPASSFFQHDYTRPRVINPAAFAHQLDGRGRGVNRFRRREIDWF